MDFLSMRVSYIILGMNNYVAQKDNMAEGSVNKQRSTIVLSDVCVYFITQG